MAFSPQEIEMLFSGAVQNYIYNWAYESRNPGCEFDMQAWVDDLNKFNSNDLMIMSRDKQKEIQDVIGNLDKYAKKKTTIELV